MKRLEDYAIIPSKEKAGIVYGDIVVCHKKIPFRYNSAENTVAMNYTPLESCLSGKFIQKLVLDVEQKLMDITATKVVYKKAKVVKFKNKLKKQ